MSLPPGFLDELRNRLSLGQVVGRKVMWDVRKSNQGKGDLWAPCPFHQEKTASFHVDDRKGFYYCFGCHAKGDAISFVRETENVDFMDAVKILAGEAGMPMPERDPQAQQKADRNAQLVEVMEQALQFFRLQLKTGAGAEARDYLSGRGLKEDALERWEIGFAPPGWSHLWAHLTGKGIAKDLIIDAGLAKTSDKGKEPYDTFRHRIMFPIRDGRGRCIAFGGRAMDPEDNAKYLNSPETPLFDKSRSLFNIRKAREAVGKGHDLIVAEGYMDVIALSEAGFEGAVAPLGTAITEHQLDMLWRIGPEPKIMLDGDTAGRRAADRLIPLAVERLRGGNSLYFVELPDGQDPDDYLKAHGSNVLRSFIDEKANPLVVQLWTTELNRRPWGTPEQKADLDKRWRALVGKIPDPDVKRYYEQAIKEYRWEKFRPDNYAPPFKGKYHKPRDTATPEAKASLLAGAVDEAKLFLLTDRLIAAIALTNPNVSLGFRDGLERFEVVDPTARTVIDSIIGLSEQLSPDELRAEVEAAVGKGATDRLLEDRMISIQPCVRKKLPADVVLHELTYNIAVVSARRSALNETIEAEEDLGDFPSQVIDNRLIAATRALDDALKGGKDDQTQYAVSDSGARMKKDELSAFEDLLNQIGFAKKGLPPKS
ncbi:DNA primase [Yoonia sp. 2307UL14-13]|uniref:DNA primase n=1 Tax=Yoonia sp. 2307UL14-13 TaxID=3126506 RepID=UPI003095F6A8